MQTVCVKNLIFIHLLPGEDIFKSLEGVCLKYNVKTGIVISGIGQLKEVSLGYFKAKNDYVPRKFKKAYELLCLNGNIIKQSGKYHFHLHVVLGDENKRTIGGHLIAGKVSVTNEIVLLKSNACVRRKLNNKTGLMTMSLE